MYVYNFIHVHNITIIIIIMYVYIYIGWSVAMGETSPWSWVLISEITEMAELTSSMAKITGWTSRIGWKVGWLIPLLMSWMNRVTYHIWFYRLVGFLSFSLDLYGFDLIPTMWWYILWETIVQFGFIWMTSWPLGWVRDTFPASQLWWCLRKCWQDHR